MLKTREHSGARYVLVALLVCIVFSANAAAPAVLGSPNYLPTPDQPIGWRGDGSGRYPGATPPTAWERKKNGTKYETQGIAWMTPLPDVGVSCPIVVGQRIFITTEIADLICIDKLTGRIAWIRSNPEFEGYSPEERKANPLFVKHLEPLIPQLTAASADLAKANAALAEALNAELPNSLNSQLKVPTAAAKKRELEKKINELQTTADTRP